MCGICGHIDYQEKVSYQMVDDMASSMKYRGPDDRGVYTDDMESFSIGLGHVRLSILDLSSLGHQPMQYENLVLVFNGEIYNFKEIRKTLINKGHTFISDSDTEVILHSFKEWGKRCVDHFIGMFAFAIFDKSDKKIYLCRDRAGVKPLYFYFNHDVFLFASELKGLGSNRKFIKEIDSRAVSVYFQMGYIPQDMCVFNNTYKLNAGCWLEYDICNRLFKTEKYWDLTDFYNLPKLNISYTDAKDTLKSLLKSAFSYRLVSDVPVGIFLSGGFDSAAVTAIISKECNVTPQTFTIGFNEGNNEAPEAEAISQLLGTNHLTRYCTSKDVLDLIPQLAFYYDEPFTDPSGIPTILVSSIAKERVKVALSADGGDEIFAGYNEYVVENEQVVKYRDYSFPKKFFFKNVVYPLAKSWLPSYRHYTLEQLNGYWDMQEQDYKEWIIHKYDYPKKFVNRLSTSLSGIDLHDIIRSEGNVNNSPDYMLLFDYRMRMKDQFLVKVDRATMSVSLEGREPMLDHRIAEFVAQLPWDFKYKDGVKKRILKDIVYEYLPKDLMDKPKRGFSLPLHIWLRRELRDYTYDVLNEKTLKENGFNSELVLSLLDAYMAKGYHFDWVWRLVQYLNWKNKWM